VTLIARQRLDEIRFSQTVIRARTFAHVSPVVTPEPSIPKQLSLVVYDKGSSFLELPCQ
jgi:hypothetical protein